MNAVRSLTRKFSSTIARRNTKTVETTPFVPAPENVKTCDLFIKLSLFLVPPVVIWGTYNAFIDHEHEHPPEFTAYRHLRIRNGLFPWGDGNHTLFHNPEVNPLPDGWETVEK